MMHGGRLPEVLDNNFLGEPFGFEEVQQRWPRLVQTLGVSEDQADAADLFEFLSVTGSSLRI